MSRKLTQKEVLDRFKKVHGDEYDYSLVEYGNNRTDVIIICHKHGEFQQKHFNHAKGSGCRTCKSSKGEREVERFLLNKNIHYEKQKKFSGCKKKLELPFDFWIPRIKTIIEYDGEQHYKEKTGFFNGKFDEIKLRDKIKNEFCQKAGFTLLRIRWDEDLNKELSMFFDAFKASK